MHRKTNLKISQVAGWSLYGEEQKYIYFFNSKILVCMWEQLVFMLVTIAAIEINNCYFEVLHILFLSYALYNQGDFRPICYFLVNFI